MWVKQTVVVASDDGDAADADWSAAAEAKTNKAPNANMNHAARCVTDAIQLSWRRGTVVSFLSQWSNSHALNHAHLHLAYNNRQETLLHPRDLKNCRP